MDDDLEVPYSYDEDGERYKRVVIRNKEKDIDDVMDRDREPVAVLSP